MRAVVYDNYGGPEVLRLEDVARPVPKDDEVLVKIFATTVNRSDCGLRSGKPFISRFFSGVWRPTHKTPGGELAGEIAAIGSSVTTFAVGEADPEWCWHSWWYWFNGSTATAAVPLNHFRTPEDTDDDWFYNYAFASRHPGGAHFSYVDGHVKFTSEKIDLNTYRGLSTIQGGETVNTD